MKNRKTVMTMMVVLLCAALIFAGCGKQAAEEPTQADTAENGSDIAMTVNGRDVSVDELKFYIANAASMNGYANGEEVDWTQTDENGNTIADNIMEQAINDLIESVLMVQLGEQNGMTLSDEEKNQPASMIDNVKKANGDEYLKLAIEATGLTSEEGFGKAYLLMYAYSMVNQDVGENRDKYIKSEDMDKYKAFKSNDKITAQHVLILNESEKFEDPKAVIDEVLDKAKGGADFNDLITEYNEDPGETVAGYTFGRGEMVPEFEEAAFALDYDEISDVVQSSYGYHIIKRIVGAAELQAYLKANAEIKENAEVMESVKVADVMSLVNNAVAKLNAMQSEAE